MKAKLLFSSLLLALFVSLPAFCQIQFAPHTIAGGELAVNNPKSVFAIDVDGDEDIDVLSASDSDDQINWYENDGNEEFTTHHITDEVGICFSVFALDVDGDEDIDVLSASCGDNIIAWYENDGSENFHRYVITNQLNWAASVFAIDVDGDGDIDVLSASWDDWKIAWYENDGLQNFTAHVVTSNADGAYSVFAIDIDGDEDIDLLSASGEDSKIAWYENLGYVSVKDVPEDAPVKFGLLEVYPNPFNSSTILSYSIPYQSFVNLSIYDITGREIACILKGYMSPGVHNLEFNANHLTSGVYFARLKAGGYKQVKKLLLIK